MMVYSKWFLLFFFILLSGPLEVSAAGAESKATPAIVFPLMAPRVSSNFGKRVHPILRFSRKHTGIDLAAPPRSHVRAVMGGKVIFADTNAGYGKMISILHPNDRVSVYAHLAEIHVNPGQDVAPGQIIGRVGSTGHSTGPHLHFEWRIKGKPVDPLSIFPSLASAAEG